MYIYIFTTAYNCSVTTCTTTCTVFLSSNRNMCRSLGQQEKLWEHELQASVSIAFSSSPKLSGVFL